MKTANKTSKTSVRQQIEQVLAAAYGSDIARELLTSYDSIINQFTTQNWKTAVLDAGHFVETVRRILQIEHKRPLTAIGKSLSPLNEVELQTLANNIATAGDTFAILLPRALFAVYAIRNKRGAGHIGPVKPNEMDASYIVYSAKWILAEIVRVKSSLPPAATMSLVEQITERQISVLWSWEGITRVLASGMTTRNEVLLLLLGSKDPISVDDLLRFTEYSNKAIFKDNILQGLHNKRLIEYAKDRGVCVLNPKGVIEAEKLLLSARF